MEAHRYVEYRVWGAELFPLREIRVLDNERVPTEDVLRIDDLLEPLA